MLPKDYSETYKAYQPTALDSKRQQNVGYSSNLHADVFTI